MTSTVQEQNPTLKRRDIHQQVTDTIIQQLEAGTIPWQKRWNGGNDHIPGMPKNLTTGKKYRGINILLLWTSAHNREFTTDDWASFKQWQEKKESVRKGERGTMIVYYDMMEKEVEGEIKKIPFLKTSVVFNRCQLASYNPVEEGLIDSTNLVERIERVDAFVSNTSAIVEHRDFRACYIPSRDIILMPPREVFKHTDHCTATEGYYSSVLHELVHWTGNAKRLDRLSSKKFGDDKYATEELVAELGAAFMCSEFGINRIQKSDHADYIAHWLKVLKDNKHCIFTAASEASKAVDYLQELQPS